MPVISKHVPPPPEPITGRRRLCAKTRPHQQYAQPPSVTGVLFYPKSTITQETMREVLESIDSDNWQLKCRPSTCDQCDQNSHEIDMHSLIDKPIIVLWPKGEVVKLTGLKTTMGKECEPCKFFRIHYCEEGTTLQMVKDERKESPEKEERFQRLRADRATRTHKYINDPTEVKNVKHLTVARDGKFNKKFDEGVCWDLYGYAEFAQIEYTDEADLIRQLEDRGHKIKHIMGDISVCVSDLPAGAKFRYQDGVKSSRDQTMAIAHQSAEAARDHLLSSIQIDNLGLDQSPPPKPSWKTNLTPRSSPGASSRVSAASSGVSPRVHNIPAGARCLGNAPVFCHSASRMDEFEDSTIEPGDSASQVGCESSEQRATPSVVSVSSSVGKRGRGKGGKGGGRDGSSTVSKKDLGVVAFPKLRAGSNAVEIASFLLNDSEAFDVPTVLWNKLSRGRDYENYLTRLSSQVNKMSALVGNVEAQTLSENLSGFIMKTEHSADLCKLLNESPETCVNQPVDEPLVVVFLKFKPELQSTMFSKTSHTLLGKRGTAPTKLALRMSRAVKDETCFCVGILLPVSKDVYEIQRNLVFAFTDKVCKRSSEQEFVDVMKGCEDIVLAKDLDVQDIAANVSSREIQPHGWSNSVHLDLVALVAFAQILAVGNNNPSRSTRQLCAAIFRAKAQLSERLRVHMRVSAGTKSHAKVAFDKIQKQWNEMESVGEALTEEELNILNTILEHIDSADSRADECGESIEEHLFDELSDMIASDKAVQAITHLAQLVQQAHDQGKDAEAESMGVLAKKFIQFMFDAIAAILAGFHHFEKYCDDLLEQGAESNHEDVIGFRFLQQLVDLMLKFEMPQLDTVVLQECRERCAVLVGLDAVDYSQKPEQVLGAFGDLFERFSKIKVTPVVEEGGNAEGVQTVSNYIKSNGIDQPICKFVEGVVGSDGCKLASVPFLARADELQGVLPPQVQAHCLSVKGYRQVIALAAAVKEGKTRRCGTLAQALLDGSAAVEPVKSKTEFVEAMAALKGEWRVVFSELQKLLDEDVLVRFVKSYGRSTDAVSRWDFKECPWLVAEKDDDLAGMVKLLEKIVPKRKDNLQVVANLVSLVQPTWARQDDISWIGQLHARRDKFEELVQNAATLVSCVILANAVNTSTCTPEIITYATGPKFFGVPLKTMPDALQQRMPETLAKVEKASKSEVGSVVTPSSQSVEPQKKKLKLTKKG